MSNLSTSSRITSAHFPLDTACAIAQASGGEDPQALFQLLDHSAHAVLQHQLLTINLYQAPLEQLTRLYSSNTQAYPIGGSKNKKGVPWGAHVLQQGKVYIGEGPEALRWAFDDHVLIQQLGLRSVINVPVRFRQQCLGTVNFLMPYDSISEAQREMAILCALLALPGLLQAHQKQA